jgi:hypothetical protein
MNDHEITTPVTLRLHTTARVERVCENTWYPDPYQGDAHCVAGFMFNNETAKMLTKGLSCGTTEMQCPACHGSGTTMQEVAVDVDITQYAFQFWTNRPYCEAIIENLLTRYENGETVEGVKEIKE